MWRAPLRCTLYARQHWEEVLDAERFDRMVRECRLLAPGSRRVALRTLIAGAFVGAALLPSGAPPAAAACLKNGKTCKRGKQCCSAICKGPRNGKTCRPAPSQGTCTIETPRTCVDGGDIECGAGCTCLQTVSGRPFCGSRSSIGCRACGDCDAGDVCVKASICCSAFELTACVSPCSVPD